jgi:RNA polymerase sigma-70 factor, ECF subfamily
MKAVIPLPDEKDQEKQACVTVDDLEYVRRFKNGDESAFNVIVKRYNQRLLQVAKVLLNDEDDAMDLTQETFVKAYFNMKSFREDSSLYTWLYRIIYNLCISSLRRKKIVSFISFDHHDEVMEFSSSTPGPDKEFDRKELKQSVMNAVEALPFKQRTVFTLKQVEGLTHGEIAKIMGITEGAVKASYFHAVRKLQGMLKNYGEHYDM